MQEKFTHFIRNINQNEKKPLIALSVLLVLLGAGIITMSVLAKQKNSTQVSKDNQMSDASTIEIRTVGADTDGVSTSTQNSWPGEIISLGNLEVQPAREGTIAAWFVHIGESVVEGQKLGRLSPPPATAELVGMLAQQSEALSKAKTEASAERTYVLDRISQLTALRVSVENAQSQAKQLLGTGAQAPLTNSIVQVKKKSARAVLQSGVARSYSIFSGAGSLPVTYGTIQLRSPFGAQNARLREAFPGTLFAVITDLKDPESVPSESGLLYFDVAIKLANASLPDGGVLSSTDLESLKTLLADKQTEFISALGEWRSAELEIVGKEKDSFSELRDIDKEIAELKKSLTISEGDVVAKQSAYGTVSGAITGGYTIVAPRSGTVSTILKKPGEFVAPGMPVAVITGSGKSDTLVRFRIPNNVRKPSVGQVLSVVRPSFPNDVKEARLIGVGLALDETGSYMADAVFTSSNDWPITSSVRVIAPSSDSLVTIKLSSILWDTVGKPYVFAVSSAGRVYAKQLIIGRTIGAEIEVYNGLVNGDRYIVKPTSAIREDMLIDDIVTREAPKKSDNSHEVMMHGMGM